MIHTQVGSIGPWIRGSVVGYYANWLYAQDAGGRARDITQGNRVTVGPPLLFRSCTLPVSFSLRFGCDLSLFSSVSTLPSNSTYTRLFYIPKVRQALARRNSVESRTDLPRLADSPLFFIHASAASYASLSLPLVLARRDFPASGKKGKIAAAAPSSHPRSWWYSKQNYSVADWRVFPPVSFLSNRRLLDNGVGFSLKQLVE